MILYIMIDTDMRVMIVHKLTCCLNCKVVSKKGADIMLCDGNRYSLIYCKKNKISLPLNNKADNIVLVIPKYKSSLNMLSSNYDFYLISKNMIEEIIKYNLYVKHLLYCINGVVIIEKDILKIAGIKF